MAAQILVQSFEKYSHSADQKNKDVTTTSFYKTTYEGSANIKFHEHSAFRLLFSRKSASGWAREFRRSAEKLPEFRILRQIFFKFRCSGNPDDPPNKKRTATLSQGGTQHIHIRGGKSDISGSEYCEK